jgi:hypothetical protein
MPRSTCCIVTMVAMLFGLLFSGTSRCQTYYCTGDVDGDSIALQVSDLTYLSAFIYFAGPPPIPIYQGDLNGDSAIDAGDIEALQCYFIYGLSCFPTYPIPTCADPDTIRGACHDTTGDCAVRSFTNCIESGGEPLLHGTDCDGYTPCAHRPPGLVAWYPFDEDGSAEDIVGKHHGYELGNASVSIGVVGNARSFGWADKGVVRVKDDPFQYIGENDFTIDAWIFPDIPDPECSNPEYCKRRPIVDNSNPGKAGC